VREIKEPLIHVASANKARRTFTKKRQRKSGVYTDVNEHFEEDSNAAVLFAESVAP